MTVSPRQLVQRELVAHLQAHASTWDARDGVVERLVRVQGGGAVRTVTWGVEHGLLDATAKIWTSDNIIVEASGALAPQVAGKYDKLDHLLVKLRAIEERHERVAATRAPREQGVAWR